MSAPQLYTVEHVAELLGKPVRWVRDPQQNPIPFHKVGHSKRFSADDINAYLASTRVVPPGPETLLTSREERRLGRAS